MLCRGCGNELVPFEYCADCNEAIQWKCSSCKKDNDRSIHVHYIEDEIQKRDIGAGTTGGAAAAALLTLVSGLSSLTLT